MAAKKTIVKPETKVETTAVKTTAPKTEEKKAEIKKDEVVAAPTKVEEKAQKAAPEKKAPVKKATAKKAEIKSSLYVQFAGKSYAQEDFMKMAKDVWKYDLKQKASALESVDLYVKPEENMVYYVMNKEFTGSFYI